MTTSLTPAFSQACKAQSPGAEFPIFDQRPIENAQLSQWGSAVERGGDDGNRKGLSKAEGYGLPPLPQVRFHA
jgi:hypothetical protein